MRKHISTQHLDVGMFLEGDVHNVTMANGEVRYFLAPHGIQMDPGQKRPRLLKGKHEEVANDGGLLLTSHNYVDALKGCGLPSVYINILKGSDLPDHLLAPPDLEQPPQSADRPEGRPAEGKAPKPAAPTDAQTQPPADEPPPFTPGVTRHNFGADNRAWMEIDVSEDAQRATLHALSFGGDTSLGKEEVLHEIVTGFGIRSGIDQEQVENLAAQAAEDPNGIVQGEFSIAQGTTPESDVDGRIDYKFLDAGADPSALPFGALKAAFESVTPESVLEGNLSVRLVAPGEELAARLPPRVGRAGQDIFGNRKRSVGKDAHLNAGPNVQAAAERYNSEIYGYVCLLGDEISVLSPIWISPDRVEAHFIHLPQTGPKRAPKKAWLIDLLKRQGVTFRIRTSTLNNLVRKPPGRKKKTALLLARGTPPVPGTNARIEYTIDVQSRKTDAFLPDGGVDLDAWDTGSEVKSGDLLAKLFPATPGQPGVDLRGQEIPGKGGDSQTLTAGGNVVRTDYKEGGQTGQAFFAGADGNVGVQDSTIQIRSVLHVDGDVDDTTGNIDTEDDVKIRGSVGAGFTVRAGGSIIIGDTVQSGATVNAHGDIVAAKGISGETTKVFTQGNLHTRFIQNGSVMALGNVTVGSFVLNAYVRSGGRLVVLPQGGERSGTIVGGRAYAVTGIEARSVGSETAKQTLIGLTPDPGTVARLHKAGQGIEACQENILRILRTLGIRDVTVPDLHLILERTPISQRMRVREMMDKLKRWTATKGQAIETQRQLQEQSAKILENAEIRIAEKVFTDVVVQIGDGTLTVPEDLDCPRFFKSPDGIIWQPMP